MTEAFNVKSMDYLQLQQDAIETIKSSTFKKIRKVVDQLLVERRESKDFEHISEERHAELVIAELAGYAAYGKLINGDAIILSPDAMSAVPAYHFGAENPRQFSPVLYAKRL
jgi:hypothetical protein